MDRSQMRFLVVDDDAAIRDLLSKILHHLGYPEVSLAATAQEALSLIDRTGEPFQCILLDIQMPGMDGAELCHILRRREAYRDVPIVMLTAMSERHYIDNAFRNGATDYIQKPFEVTDLGIRIGVAIKLATSQAELRAAKVVQGDNDKPASAARIFFEDAVVLNNAPRTTEYPNFEKYVTALPLRVICSTQAVAIRIAGLREIHAEVSGENFVRLLNFTADCVASAQSETGPLYTYAGSGVFLLLQIRGEPFYAGALHQRFQETVREYAETIAEPALIESLHIQIGAPVKLWTLRRHDRIASLRAATLNVLSTQIGNRASNCPVLKKADYQALLQEFERDADGFISHAHDSYKKTAAPEIDRYSAAASNRLPVCF